MRGILPSKRMKNSKQYSVEKAGNQFILTNNDNNNQLEFKWNKEYYEDLRKVMIAYQPQIGFIQEMKLQPTYSPSMRGYNVFRQDNISDGHACSGVEIGYSAMLQ